MAKAVISSVLESLLGKYVDGLGGDSLQVGLWSGELTLQNLTLKPHALAELQLPVTVVKGSIRRVHVVVPWNQLGSASVQVAIEGVYALVTPNTKLPSSEEIRLGKRAQLERQELLRQHDRLAEANNQDGEDESTFVSRLMTRIVDNLQITLCDVHLRYEDNVSNPDVPFACGLMIQSFTFHTTDAEGRDVFVDRTTKRERFLHKAATLAALGVYWDRLPKGDKTALLQHRPNIDKAMGEMVHAMAQRKDETLVRDGKDPRLWIARPCNLSVRITKNETTDFSHAAKYTVHTELNGFVCALSREQYEDMLFLNRAFAGRRAIEAHFLNARCRPFHRTKDRPRQWWDYAVRLVITKKVLIPGQTEPKKLKTVRLRFSSVKKSSQERKRYIEAFRMQLRKGSPLDPATKEFKAQTTFEMTYPVDVIMALRNVAEDAEANARRQRLEKEKAQQAAAASAQDATAGSWYGYFFGAPAAASGSASTPLSPSASAASKRALADTVLTAEGRANLKKAYDEVVAQETSHEVPATCNLLSVKIHLRCGQLALYSTKQTAPFLVGSLDGSLAIDVHPTNDWETRCRVQHFEILNGLAEGTRFQTFCSLGKITSASKGPCASLDVAYSTRSEASANDDDNDEPTKVTAVRARFTMAPVRLMVDPAFVAFLQRFFVSMLPANQLDKVWSFATSSVSEWIFSEQDEEELYRQAVDRKTRMEFDVGVDFMAPVVVLTESITDNASPTVVVDLGRFQFQNEPLPAISNPSAEQRLYWSTEMSRVNVLLGRLSALSAQGVGSNTEGFDQVVEEFSIKFALNSSVSSPGYRPSDAVALLTPIISAKALLPRVVMKVSQDQIMALGRVHSSLQAQLFGNMDAFDDAFETDGSDAVEQEIIDTSNSSSQASKHPKPLKDKYALQLALEIGEAVLHLKERSSKDAFRLRVTGTAFEMAMFTSQTIVQARLHALVLEDSLHSETSKFFHLLSTGEASEDVQELIALDVTMFGDEAALFHPDREADTVATLRCNVLHVQWNPSSIALLYQILSVYATALQSHVIDIPQPTHPALAPSMSGPQQTNGGKPVFLARASLVQLSVTFNKDQFDRQLVRVAMEDASVEYVTKGSNEEHHWNEVTGQLGNFVATDLSLKKHALYSPLVGLDADDTYRQPHERSRRRTVSSTQHPLLAFVYTWHDDPSVQSVLKLAFEPVRVVYYHQQVMELVDYLFEGILGAMVAETLATATRLLLNEEASSTRFEVTVKKSTLILPIRLQDAAHWCLTSDSLFLEHFPSSVICYRGLSPTLAQRQRDVSLFASGEHIGSIIEETSAEEISIRADCKRVRLTNATIYCATSDSRGGITYSSVLRTPTHLSIDVDDLVSAGSLSLQCRALPRLTVRVSMEEVAFELERWQYRAMLALIEGNFGADLLVANSNGQQIDHASRPAMVYSYSRTDLEVVTMQLIFEMAAVQCDLFQDAKSAIATAGLGVTDIVDHVVERPSPGNQHRGLPVATLTGTQLSASINQLHDRWPSIVVRVDGFSLQDRATNCLRHLDGQDRISADLEGLIFHCQRPFEISYAWHVESKQCKIDVNTDHLHGVVVPESILLLLDYLTVPSSGASPSPPPTSATMGRRLSLTESMFTESSSVGQDAYDLTVVLRGKDMSVAFPEDLSNASSEQIAMRADFSIQYTWKPQRRADEQQAGGSDLDIQSSVVIDGTGIELFARNARRQGCASSAGSQISSSGAAGHLVQIVEPCDVHVEVSDLFPHAGQQQQIVAFKFSPIEVYASYEDACVIMEVIDASTRSLERHSATSDRTSAMTRITSSGGSLETVVSTTEVHRYFTCDVGAMSLTLINDCDGCDMGLVQLETQRCNLFLNVTNTPPSSSSFASPPTTLSGGGGLVTLISYYNPDTRDWHPMCSEWGLDVSVQGSIYDARADLATRENELHVIVTATHPLDLAVTHGLLEVVASAGGAWNRRSTQPLSAPPSPSTRSGTRPDRRRTAKAPSVIRNDTGLPLTFWLASSPSAYSASHADASPALTIVPSGDIADLHYVHSQGRGCGVARKYANRDRAKRQGMRLHLHLADAPFQPIHGIEFEQLGSRAFSLLDARSGASTNFTLNCHAQLVDGRIVVTISSQIKVVSTLAMPLQLLVNDPAWASPVEVGILYPNRESAVPVMASLGTELRVRPLADAVYSWSAPIPIQTRSDVDLRVESTSSEATKSAIFCVAMTLAQSLRVVRFAEPIVLVNKLPVELAFRVKSSLGGGASASGGSSAASSRERMAVGATSGVWWTDHRHRPQFELAINGCQTSRWIELTQATNMASKSGSSTGDVVSVMLLRHDGRPFKLLLQIVEQAPAKSLHIFFYAEMWFINRTGLDLVFGNESEAESYFPPTSARTLVGNAQISAYSSSSESPTAGAPTVRLSMPSCGWSSRFTADPRRLSWQDECLTLQAAPGGRRDSSHGINMLYEFGVSADYATRHFGSITTLISVIPRYLVINQSPYTVLLLEDSSATAKSGALYSGTGEAHHILAKGDVYALYWVSGTRSRLRASVLGESTEFGWSEGVSFDQAKSGLVTIPEASHNGSRSGGSHSAVNLQIVVKQGSISQASMVIVITEAPSEEATVDSDAEQIADRTSAVGWNILTVHTQLAGLVVTLADKPATAAGDDDSGGGLFGATNSSVSNESVARLTITRVTAELSSTMRETSAKLNVMGIKVEDLLPRSKNPVVLRPVTRGESFSSASKRDKGDSKCFLAITFLEKPHPKYRWVERLHIEVQDVRIATSMQFVDRLNKLTAETMAHFDSHAYAETLSVFDDAATNSGDRRGENILEYFVTTDDDDASAMAMASITGNKVFLESCEIAPVRVVVSFSREKGDVRNDPNAGFWLSNLKFKIDNAYLTLDAFKLSHAMATQEALVQSLSAFYVKSVKSQALGLIESVQVTTLVTSVVTSGVSSLMSTIMGKTDPSLANANQAFRYQFLTNNQLITKHSKLLAECQSTAQFLQQVKHLVYDWDSNHTGLEARGCVALGILNNSRQSVVINVQLNDGAEIRVLPVGRKHLASAMGGGSGGEAWRSDRSMVIFAWGYTPTLLTSGDVYFTVQSNACNVFVTRKTARLKANIGYTATFTHQEVQPWWATNVVIVGDDLHGHVSSGASSSTSLFGDVPATPTLPPVPVQPSQSHGILGDEYEVVFSTPSLGLIAKQSGPRNVIVRECLTLANGAPSPALACGQIAHGDTILTVGGVAVTNTTQFRDLVGASPRPVVLRFRRTGERFQTNAAFDLFGEKQSSSDDAFRLFG